MIAKETEDFLLLFHFNRKGEDYIQFVRWTYQNASNKETRMQLNLHEPEAALAWIDAFKARCRAEKKADVPAAGTTPADFK